MGKVTIQNPNIDEWIVIDDVEYHIGRNTTIESDRTYVWNIYRKTDQKWFIGTLRMDRTTINEHGGRSVMVTVWKESEQVHKCWVSVGLLKNKETLIGVVRGCVRMKQI